MNRAPDSNALHALSARALREGYAAGSFSPVEVAQAVLARMARWEPHLHATWLLRPERALAEARASEARGSRSSFRYPLF